MGRFVSGDWSWKFAFGDQPSTFGEVLEQVTKLTEDCHVNRYVGTEGQGEQVELHVDDWDQMADAIAQYVGKDFKVAKDTTVKLKHDYWDKLMMRKFLKEMYVKGPCEWDYNFHIEY